MAKGWNAAIIKNAVKVGLKVIFDMCLKAIEEMSYVDTCGKGILRRSP